MLFSSWKNSIPYPEITIDELLKEFASRGAGAHWLDRSIYVAHEHEIDRVMDERKTVRCATIGYVPQRLLMMLMLMVKYRRHHQHHNYKGAICKMTSRRKLPFLKVMLGQVSLDPPTPSVTSFIVHEIKMGMSIGTRQKCSYQILQQILYGMRNRIWQFSLGLKYKECFNKSLNVVFEVEIIFE